MERVYTVPVENVDNAVGIIAYVRDNAPTLGWEVYDDQVSTSKYVVLKSTGFENNNNRLPCYLKVRSNNSTVIGIDLWLYWNNTSHVGAGFLNNDNSTFYQTYSMTGLQCDGSTYNRIYIKGNKDFIFFENFKPSTTATYRVIAYRIDNPFWDYIGTTVSGTLPGDNVILPLGSGETSQFRLNKSYRIISPTGYVDKVKVTYIDTANDSLVIDNLHYTMVSGTKIGSCGYPWISVGQIDKSNNYSPNAMTSDSDYYYSTTHSPSNPHAGALAKGIPGSTSSSEFINHTEITVEPYMFYEPSYGRWGHSSYVQYLCYGANNDIVGINQVDVGLISVITTTEVTGLTNTWLVNALVGMGIIITSGSEDGVVRYIVSNTINTITVDPPFDNVPIVGDSFTICESFYRYISQIGGHYYFGIKEV